MEHLLQHSQAKKIYKMLFSLAALLKLLWLRSLGTSMWHREGGSALQLIASVATQIVCQIINRYIALQISNSNWVFLWEFLSNSGRKA